VQEEMKEAFERKVQEMRDETSKSLHNMELGRMFSMDESMSQQRFTTATVGLQTHEQYKNKAKMYLNHETEHNASSIIDKLENHLTQKLRPTKSKSMTQANVLSFADDDDEEEEEDDDDDDDAEQEDFDLASVLSKKKAVTENEKKRKAEQLDEASIEEEGSASPMSTQPAIKRRKIIHKNPNVNTSFLPDPERDLEDAKLRKELEKEWYGKQKQIKAERLEITYSYWDGSGHRRSIEITKGMSIGEFLELVRKELSTHFSELRGISGDYLMYIKDDLIIPHSYLFYDLISAKARGKSGHLMFKNQIYDKGDYVIDKDSGHPGKVITRAWYDRNKHIFPASRWELYDPQSHSK